MVIVHSSNSFFKKKGKPINLPMSCFKSRAMYCEANTSPSLLEILSFIFGHMGKVSLQRFFFLMV
jgi:hypothetical protein